MWIADSAKLTCPHCLTAFRANWVETDLDVDPDGEWQIHHIKCASCDRLIVVLRQYAKPPSGRTGPATVSIEPELKAERLVWPAAIARHPVPPNVPSSIGKDYTAARRVLPESLEASAALSRRCLQNLLVAKAGVKRRHPADQIQEVLDSKQLPARLAADLDAVRVVGNFGAHPIKSESTGEIVDVEPGETEWVLDVLERMLASRR